MSARSIGRMLGSAPGEARTDLREYLMSATRELTATELEALAAKLDALDLNDAE